MSATQAAIVVLWQVVQFTRVTLCAMFDEGEDKVASWSTIEVSSF